MIILSDELCQIEMNDGNPCGRQMYKDKKKCIFHLENKSDDDAKIFEIAFWKELDRMENDKDIRELDFTRFIFPARIDFHGHLFEKHVNFSDAQFNDIAVFSQAHFNNITVFSNAHFNKNVSFAGTHFNKHVSFQITHFKKSAYFNGTEFHSGTFYNAVFWDAGYFIGTKFLPNKENINLFGNGRPFDDLIFFEDVKFHQPKDVRFHNIDLSNVSFMNTNVTEVEFLDANWAKKNGRLAVIDETLIEKKPYSTTYGAVAQLYRRLRLNYENNYRFSEAGEFFIGEMEMLRLDVNKNNEKKSNIVLRLKKNVSFLGLYKLLSLYGESYIRPMIWALIVIVSYPMLMHWLFDASLPQSDDFLYTYLRTSAASFLQMDSTYIGERVIGFLLLGLLFIALKRKFERKK